MKDPLVSVIIPTYNRSTLLKRAVDSVLNQTHTNLECIIIDDGSTDNTKQTIVEYEDDRIIYIRHKVNKHLSAARNTGIEEADGDYIAFLDDDDEWRPEKIEKQLSIFEKGSPKLGLVYCWMNYYENSGSKLKERHPNLRGNIFSSVLTNQPLGNGSTYLFSKKAVNETGKFDENLKRGIDGDYVRRLCYNFEVDYVPEVLVNYYLDHGSKRITRDDKEGINQAIKGHKIKLKKFDNLKAEYPKQYSSILANIAFNQWKLGNYKGSTNTFLKAFQVHPFHFDLYHKILSSLKTILRTNGK